MRNKFLVVGFLVAILIVPVLLLGVLILATQESRAAPTAITGLIAIDASYARSGQIDLFWSPSDAKDFAYYSIYASETEITDVTELPPVGRINDRTDVTYQATRYRVFGLRLALVDDTKYWFGVTVVDSAGNESNVGTSVSATIEKMPPPSSTSAVEIEVDYYIGFNPTTVTVSVGDTVTWIPAAFFGFEIHSITSDTGLFHTEVRFTSSPFSYTFTQAGVFGYHCEFHVGETGKVIVE